MGLVRNVRSEAFRPYITMVLAFFMAWAIASLLWVEDYDRALNHLVSRGFQLISCIMVINFCIVGPLSMRHLSRIMTIAVLIPIIVGYYGYFATPNPLCYQFSYEFPRYIGDRNSDTFMILTGLPFALAISLTGAHGRLWSMFGLIAFLLMTAAIFLSLSRANLLVMIVITFAIVGTNFVLQKRRGRSLVLVATLCAVLPLAAAVVYTDRFSKTVTQYEKRFEDVQDDNRWVYVLAVWELVGRNPLIGVGLDNFPYQFHSTGIGRFWYRPETNKPVPHNSFLSVWAELGTLGLIAFLMIVLWPLVSILRLLSAARQRLDPLINCLFLGALGLSLVLIQGIAAYNFAEIFYYWIAYSIDALVVLALDRSLRHHTG